MCTVCDIDMGSCEGTAGSYVWAFAQQHQAGASIAETECWPIEEPASTTDNTIDLYETQLYSQTRHLVLQYGYNRNLIICRCGTDVGSCRATGW